MRIRSVSLSFAIVCAMLTSTICQDRTPPQMATGGPSSLGQLLKQRNVTLTKESLLNSLRNRDPEVRYLAAAKLAEDGAQDAIPAIKEALAAEKVPASRINIAFALAQLGDDVGIRILRTECEGDAVPAYLKARAITYLQDIHKEDCLNTALQMLQSQSDPESQILALSIIPGFKQISKQDSEKVFKLTVTALSNPTPTVRMNASIALGTLRNASAVPYLQTAIAREGDDVVRSTMESVLQELKSKEPGQ